MTAAAISQCRKGEGINWFQSQTSRPLSCLSGDISQYNSCCFPALFTSTRNLSWAISLGDEKSLGIRLETRHGHETNVCASHAAFVCLSIRFSFICHLYLGLVCVGAISILTWFGFALTYSYWPFLPGSPTANAIDVPSSLLSTMVFRTKKSNRPKGTRFATENKSLTSSP